MIQQTNTTTILTWWSWSWHHCQQLTGVQPAEPTSCHSPPSSLSLLSSMSLSVSVLTSDATMHPPPPPPPRSIHSLSFLYYNYWSHVYSSDNYQYPPPTYHHAQYQSLDSYSVSDTPGYFSDFPRIRRHSGSSHVSQVSHRHVAFDPRYSYKESFQKSQRNGTVYQIKEIWTILFNVFFFGGYS